jgi:hypothetical protein
MSTVATPDARLDDVERGRQSNDDNVSTGNGVGEAVEEAPDVRGRA